MFFFEDRLVQLPGNPPGTSAFSPTLGEIGVQLDRRWSAPASGQWDVLNDADNNNFLQQTAYRIAYNGDDGRFVRDRYGKSQDVTEYTDLAFTWPVSEQVSLIGRWAYSLDLDENMEALAGIDVRFLLLAGARLPQHAHALGQLMLQARARRQAKRE